MTPKHISTPNLASLWLAGLLPLIFLNETFNLLLWDFFEILVPLFFVLSDLALSHRTRGKSKGKHLSPRQHLFFSHCFLFSFPQNVGTSRNQEQEIFHNLSVRRQVVTKAGIVSSPSLAQVVWFLKRMERRLSTSHHRDHVAHAKYGCGKEHLSLAWKFVTKCPFCITWLLNHLYQIYGSFRWISWKWLQRLKNTKTANVYVHALTAGGHRNIWKSSRHQGISWGCSALHVVFYFILILKTFLLFNLFLGVVRNCLIHFKLF